MTKLVALKLIDDDCDKVVIILFKNSFPKLTDIQFRQHAVVCARLIGSDRRIKIKPVRVTVRTRLSLQQKRRRR